MLIIYPPAVHWEYMMARPQQLMLELAAQGDTAIFCEPGNHSEKKLLRLDNNLWLNYGTSLEEGPIRGRNEKTVLWVSYPGNVSLIGKYQEDLVVFDVLDYPDEDFSLWKPFVNELIKKSQVIVTVSKPLLNHFKKLHSNVHLVRNGVDYHHFANTANHGGPQEFENLTRPIVGYYGALAPWVDWRLIAKLADLNPAVSFVFIGPVVGMEEFNLPQRPNLYYLGRRAYQELPRYGVSFDVCILPFRKTRMTKYVNPVKVYEYLAMGKPVITTNLPETKAMTPHVYVAENLSKFQSCLNTCLKHLSEENSREKRALRQQFARENTWARRVQEIKVILKKALE